MAQKITWFVQAFAPNRGMLKPGKRDLASSAAGDQERRGLVDPLKGCRGD